MSDAGRGEHVSSEQLAAYLDRGRTDPHADYVELHLAECTQCRADLMAVTRVVRTVRLRRLALIASLAGVAAVVTLVVTNAFGTGTTTRGPAGDPFRSAPTEGVLRLEVLAPTDGQVVIDSSAVLRWVGAGADVSYRVTVTDIGGDEVWSVVTRDSTIALTGVHRVTGSGRYYWYVDALLPDGRSATTGVHQFELAF